MYEEKTYESILDRMLDRVGTGVDTREGSVIWDALGPSAYVLAETYFLLNNYTDLLMPDTSAEGYQDSFYGAFGIDRKAATRALRKVVTSEEVDVGTRWALNDTSYVISEKISETEYKALCEQYGAAGNIYYGKLQSITGMTNVTAELDEVLSAGIEKENDEQFRKRFYLKIRMPSTSGNKYDYYNWAMACSGVGAAKVFPLSSGPGTVKVVIADANMGVASAELLEDVKEYIEELRPIGATVTVKSAVEKTVNVSAKISISNGDNLGALQNVFQELLTQYLRENAFQASYVSLARIGNLLLDVQGIEDYGNLLLNGAAANIPLSNEDIAVVGNIILEVMA